MPSPGSASRGSHASGHPAFAGEGTRAPRLRLTVEWVLRVAIVALLAFCLVESLHEGGAAHPERIDQGELASALPRWSTSSAPTRVEVTLDHPPEGRERDWLAALAGAGTEVGWTGPALLPTAVTLEPRADPAGGVDASVSAPPGKLVMLRDSVGELGGAPASAWGVSAVLPPLPSGGLVDAVVGPVAAQAVLRDSLHLRSLLVIGAASWETKFVIAALEERGWNVDAHVVVSPKGDVRQGTTQAIDTTRYSAVLALDTTAARYADRIGRYVRQGGGLVLWGPVASTRAFSAITPVRAVGGLREDEGHTVNDTLPRADLALVPLAGLTDDAELLERRGEHVAIAARRLGAGRVVVTGYTDSWRWRMAGGEDAPEAHREWLAGMVAQVAQATLIDRLGSPSAGDSPTGSPDASRWFGWMFAAISAALLVEWASRRLRGAP